MVYRRPPYLVRLPGTVKELLRDMQTKARQLQWSIMGDAKDVTLTLTWQCKQRSGGKRTKEPKQKQKSQDDLSTSDWVSDTELSQYQQFSKQLEIVQTISKLASSIAKKPTAGNLPGTISETKVAHCAVSPQDIDDGYLTEKATPDEMHVYPKVVVRPPFYLPSRETLINGGDQENVEVAKSHSVPVPVPLPPPPPPPVSSRKQSMSNHTESTSDPGTPTTPDTATSATSPTDMTDQNKDTTILGASALHDILETGAEDEEAEAEPEMDPLQRNTWEMSKSSIDQSTEDCNTSFDRLLTPGSDCTDTEIGSAIRFGKYVKFQDTDSEVFYGSDKFYQDWEPTECDYLGTDLDQVIHLEELENSPRHKLSYIAAESGDNLNKKKKVKRKNSFQKLFAPWQRKKKYDKKKPQKSPKLGRKVISPKPLYLERNYVSTPSSTPGSEDTNYSKVIEYQRVKTGRNRQGGDVPPETWDSSLDSQHLQQSVDHCLRSCDSILSRQAHTPSNL